MIRKKMASVLTVGLMLLFVCNCAVLQSVRLKSSGTISGIYYYLPLGKVKVNVIKETKRISINKPDGTKGFKEDISYQLKYVETLFGPDPDKFYLLKYKPSITSDDEVEVSLTSKGLLDKIKVTTHERTAEFFVQIPKGIADIAPAATVTKETFEEIFDPTDAKALDAFQEKYKTQQLKIKLQKLFKPDEFKKNKTVGDMKRVNGVCFRPVLPYRLELSTPELVSKVDIYLPNEAPVLFLNITRAAFVEKVTEIDFDNGILKKIAIKKPSEAMGFLHIPIGLAKAVVSIPAEILQIKINAGKQDKNLKKLEEEKLELEKKILELKHELAEKNKKNGNDDPLD